MQVGAGLVQGRLRVKNEMRGKEFPVAQKIYGALLRAYPPAHRAEYGAAMAQLFRDQCRDAWGESKHFGLLKLWLRVLPDWAKTSIMERLAALNERKTMNEKLANLGSFQTPPAKIFSRVFVAVFLIVFIASVAVTLLLPESYASTSQVLLGNHEAQSNANHALEYDPYFIQTQLEIVQSQAVLEPVIVGLNLNEAWGYKYSGGQKLKTEETVEILRGRLRLILSPVRNPMIISIQVFSDDKNEAAMIANAIADSYLNQSLTNFKSEQRVKSDVLDDQFALMRAQERQIKFLTGELEALIRQFSARTNGEAMETATAQPITQMKEKLAELEVTEAHIEKKYLAAGGQQQLASFQIQKSLVSRLAIVQKATPGKIAVKPNRPLNIVLGGFFGLLLAGAVGGVAFFISKSRQRNRAPDALVGS